MLAKRLEDLLLDVIMLLLSLLCGCDISMLSHYRRAVICSGYSNGAKNYCLQAAKIYQWRALSRLFAMAMYYENLLVFCVLVAKIVYLAPRNRKLIGPLTI
jgi:hypothetical protein